MPEQLELPVGQQDRLLDMLVFEVIVVFAIGLTSLCGGAFVAHRLLSRRNVEPPSLPPSSKPPRSYLTDREIFELTQTPTWVWRARDEEKAEREWWKEWREQWEPYVARMFKWMAVAPKPPDLPKSQLPLPSVIPTHVEYHGMRPIPVAGLCSMCGSGTSDGGGGVYFVKPGLALCYACARDLAVRMGVQGCLCSGCCVRAAEKYEAWSYKESVDRLKTFGKQALDAKTMEIKEQLDKLITYSQPQPLSKAPPCTLCGELPSAKIHSSTTVRAWHAYKPMPKRI